MAGRQPDFFCHERFQFEDYENKKWPNLVILEFSMNCDIDWVCAKDTDRLIHTINNKYSFRNLELPAYMFIDINKIAHVLLPFQFNRTNTAQDRIDRMNSLNVGSYSFNKGAVARSFLMALALFYGYPMLSFGEATFPAFTRHFIAHDLDFELKMNEPNDFKNRWPYTADGTHLSSTGATYLADKIMRPFFINEFNKYDPEKVPKDQKRSCYNFDLKMFPSDNYKMTTISHWSSWGDRGNTLLKLFKNDTDQWKYQSLIRHSIGHTCYGTNVPNATLFIDFDIPKFCKTNPEGCLLRVGYIHSWNTSYIGDADFEFYEPSITFTSAEQCLTKIQ